MHRITGSSLSLIVAASVYSLPAFALAPPSADALGADDRAGSASAAICEFGAFVDQPVLLAAFTGESWNPANAWGPPDAGKAVPAEPGDTGTDNAGDTVLSLMQPGPRPPESAARTVDNERPEDWARTAERPMPEPGLWVVLIAGFLGVCAMARRRIVSS